MTASQIKILLENNELDLLIVLVKNAYGRNLFNKEKAQKLSRLLSKLYQIKKSPN